MLFSQKNILLFLFIIVILYFYRETFFETFDSPTNNLFYFKSKTDDNYLRFVFDDRLEFFKFTNKSNAQKFTGAQTSTEKIYLDDVCIGFYYHNSSDKKIVKSCTGGNKPINFDSTSGKISYKYNNNTYYLKSSSEWTTNTNDALLLEKIIV